MNSKYDFTQPVPRTGEVGRAFQEQHAHRWGSRVLTFKGLEQLEGFWDEFIQLKESGKEITYRTLQEIVKRCKDDVFKLHMSNHLDDSMGETHLHFIGMMADELNLDYEILRSKIWSTSSTPIYGESSLSNEHLHIISEQEVVSV